ncbi:hypothetical protein BMG05_15570 [Mycobacterium malmoense]|nr:hypothetical protein BMG05_15570 [Mycobacterium malmoense]
MARLVHVDEPRRRNSEHLLNAQRDRSYVVRFRAIRFPLCQGRLTDIDSVCELGLGHSGNTDAHLTNAVAERPLGNHPAGVY